jgi:archaeal chaperonin
LNALAKANVAQKLRTWAASIPGREHYAVLAFADAIESIPITLAENGGMDVIDTLTGLRSMQESMYQELNLPGNRASSNI